MEDSGAGFVDENVTVHMVTHHQHVPPATPLHDVRPEPLGGVPSAVLPVTNLPPLVIWIVAVVTPPAHGTLSAFTGTKATYTPAPGYSGPDTFTFRGENPATPANASSARRTPIGSSRHAEMRRMVGAASSFSKRSTSRRSRAST